jgi:hypothetical protein
MRLQHGVPTNGQRVVVVRREVAFSANGFGGRRRMVLGGIWSACGVKRARSRLKTSAGVVGRRALDLNCAWSHGC